MSIYHDKHRELQRQFDSEPLADRLESLIVKDEIEADDKAFIESREFFYLSSVMADGCPTVSFKGGAAGFVRVLDEKTLAFPSYNGNGMFFSMGNLVGNPAIGCLFMDFEVPRRIRFHGRAEVSATDPLLSEYPESELIVRVTLTQMWVNCPRYIPTLQRREASKNVPGVLPQTPLADWKRMEVFHDVLPAQDRETVDEQGGPTGMDQQGEAAPGSGNTDP